MGSATPIAGPHARLTGRAARGWGRGGGVRLAPCKVHEHSHHGRLPHLQVLDELAGERREEAGAASAGQGFGGRGGAGAGAAALLVLAQPDELALGGRLLLVRA